MSLDEQRTRFLSQPFDGFRTFFGSSGKNFFDFFSLFREFKFERKYKTGGISPLALSHHNKYSLQLIGLAINKQDGFKLKPLNSRPNTV